MNVLALRQRPEAPPSDDAPPPVVRLHGVSASVGAGADRVDVLAGVDLEVGPREFVCIVGGSGCGKSTLLSLVAGLLIPTAGRVATRGGRPALMWQEPALLPWLTVARNVELPLRCAGMARPARHHRVAELLELVRLQDVAHRRPHELSGGMRQRVALARALAQDAPLLLLDEPFGSLDAITRGALHSELLRIWEATGVSVLFVTHDVGEAVRLADRVVVLGARPGRIVASATVPARRPRRPDAPGVAELTASVTDILRREVDGDDDR